MQERLQGIVSSAPILILLARQAATESVVERTVAQTHVTGVIIFVARQVVRGVLIELGLSVMLLALPELDR